MEKEIAAGMINAAGTIAAALIVGVAGGLISHRFSRERDRQDKESQWRQHAIELTKLDLQRKIKNYNPQIDVPLRPGILDFLANYRDLQELDAHSPADLYERILSSRIQQHPERASDPEA